MRESPGVVANALDVVRRFLVLVFGGVGEAPDGFDVGRLQFPRALPLGFVGFLEVGGVFEKLLLGGEELLAVQSLGLERAVEIVGIELQLVEKIHVHVFVVRWRGAMAQHGN